MIFVTLLSLLISKQALAQAPFPSFADLAERLLPSVVNISTLHAPELDGNAEDGNFASSNTVLDNYFNPKPDNQVSLGSGFIFSTDGYIITNYHVIDKAEEISVILSDNTQIEAKLIGKDKKTDLALIKIDTDKKLVPVTMGDSDKIRIGDWILAIGNPFGLGGSVTAGIISAKSRDIESGPYDSFIQTDAAINQGSSGGPMFNMDGEVIGINSAIFSTTGTSMGIGFAIPTNLAGWVISQLKEKGEAKRGWIGIKIQPNSEEIAASMGLSANEGVVVSGLSENASAQRAGVKAGDIILKFDGHIIDNTKNLSRLVAETPIGKKAPLEIWRGQQKLSLTAVIEEMPAETSAAPKPQDQNSSKKIAQDGIFIEELQISASEITPEIIDKFSLAPDAKGILVTGVADASDAAKKGLRKGDLIVKIDKQDVWDIQGMQNLIAEAKAENNRPVLLLLQDKGIMHFAAVKLKAKE